MISKKGLIPLFNLLFDHWLIMWTQAKCMLTCLVRCFSTSSPTSKTRSKKNHLRHCLTISNRYVPTTLSCCQSHHGPWLFFYFKLDKGASDARGDDLFAIHGQLATWLNRLESAPQPLIDPEDQANWGIQHYLCGLLLCPIEFDCQWKNERYVPCTVSGYSDNSNHHPVSVQNFVPVKLATTSQAASLYVYSTKDSRGRQLTMS